MEVIKDLGLKDAGTRTRRFVLVKCPTCSSTEEMRADSKAILNTTCRTCRGFNKVTVGKVSTTSAFISKATGIHNGAYSYNNSVFIKAAEKVLVTCNHHGDFKISPNNHLRGKGCPSCSLIKRGWNRSIYLNYPATLYLVKVNNYLYKIGITRRTVQERYAKDVRDGVVIEIIYEQHFFEGTDAYDVEKLLLSKTMQDRYKGPTVLHNGGDTELRLTNCSDIFTKCIKEYNETN